MELEFTFGYVNLTSNLFNSALPRTEKFCSNKGLRINRVIV